MVYIDRQLAGPYGTDRYRYTQPPFVAPRSRPGLPGTRRIRKQIYRRKPEAARRTLKSSNGSEQDRRLRCARRNHTSSTLLRRHTIEGHVLRPHAWRQRRPGRLENARLPRPQMSYRAQVGNYNGVAYRIKSQSLQQVLGYPVKPWED